MIAGRCNFIEDWIDWDSSIHEDEAQISRQGRAMTYPFDFNIVKEAKIAYFSSTTDIPFYKTTLGNCNCYDFQERKLPCKHIYRLAVELGIIAIINRPSLNQKKLAEVKASADIDNHPEQLKRIASAKKSETAPAVIDRDNMIAEFKGSGKEPYITFIKFMHLPRFRSPSIALQAYVSAKI